MITKFKEFMKINEGVDNISDYVKDALESGFQHSERFPSQCVAKVLNMPELFTEWKMPYGLTHDECCKVVRYLMFKKDTKDLADLENKIVDCNPELKPYKSENDYNLLFGVISKFNLDDIAYHNTCVDKQKNGEDIDFGIHSDLYKRQEYYFKKLKVGNEHLGWGASPATLDKIKKKFGFRK